MAGLLVFLLLASAATALTVASGRIRPRDLPSADPEGRRGISDAPLILDLLAAMLSSGASVEKALALVAETCEPRIRSSLARVHAARMLGSTWESAWQAASDVEAADRVADGGRWVRLRRRRHAASDDDGVVADVKEGLRFATSTGAPSAALLHAHAAQLRRRHNREAGRRAAALGVQLVLPLGLCSLPAFICLGIVPVVLGLLPAL